jgi:catechol 2,3-dioxygenase-like lactoylglutathione lyase family enzyme
MASKRWSWALSAVVQCVVACSSEESSSLADAALPSSAAERGGAGGVGGAGRAGGAGAGQAASGRDGAAPAGDAADSAVARRDAGSVHAGADAASEATAEDDSGIDAPRTERALCSGCASEPRDPSDLGVRVHHVHLNVASAAEAIAYYTKFYGAEAVWLNDVALALWADPILLLLDEVDYPLSDTLEMGFEHVGLGVPDVVGWFEQASAQGVVADTRHGALDTPVSIPSVPGSSPFMDPEVDNFTFIYLRGPNHERIEVWSGLLRFRHLHFLTPDIDATVAWYEALLDIAPLLPSAADSLGTTNGISIEGVQMNFLAPWPEVEMLVPTDDRPVGHLALSVQNLDHWFERANATAIPIVSPPALTPHGFRSFFVRAPDQVLLEFVEAAPIAQP